MLNLFQHLIINNGKYLFDATLKQVQGDEYY